MSAVQSVSNEKPSTSAAFVNDFSITVGTVNGSGSQTSNLTLLRALFKMGIPVSGKNLFPSNIQGLPTWFTIRVSKDGYLARRDEHEIVVAMNPATFARDLDEVLPGGVFLYADHIKQAITRDDIYAYPVPAKKLAQESGAPSNLRDYVANMAYVGVLAFLLNIDMEKIYAALDFHFKSKEKPVAMNFGLVQAAYDWATENLEKKDPYRVEPMNATEGYIMSNGNTAAGLGSLYGGAQFISWYPITPATSLAETVISFSSKLRKDPKTGKATVVSVQTEDELAAIGMAMGAGWGGLRAMTSTSGPGISLMTEFVGFAYYAEIPVVIWDVQRVGPSTGLPTRTQQGDISMIYFLGHGDTEQIMLFPGSINECFEFGWRAFDISEHFQAPTFVLSDLDFGMNTWMTKPFEYPDQPINRGKVVWEDDLEKWEGEWGRYLDVDGDSIPYRSVIGNRHPKSGYFTRGTGHDEFANYSEAPEVWVRMNKRIKAKYQAARDYLPQPVVRQSEDAKIGVISIGSADPAVQEAFDMLAAQGIKIDYMRVRAVPFANSVRKFIENHSQIYVVELNRDGQLHQLLTLDNPDLATRLHSAALSDGMPLTARWVAEAIMGKEQQA